MRLKLLIATSMLSLALGSEIAQAESPMFYFGVHGGRSIGASEISNTGSTFVLDGLASSGYVIGVHAGVDMKLPNSMVFAGVFGGYDGQNTQFKVINSPNTFTADLDRSWYGGGRTGVIVNGSKVYALVAYRQTDWHSSVPTLALTNLRGFDLGLGVEMKLAKSITFGIEGVRTQYQNGEFSFGTPASPTGIHQQLDQYQILARLNFEFGGAEQRSLLFPDDPPPVKGSDPKLKSSR